MIPKFRAWHIAKKIMRDVLAVDFKYKTARIHIKEGRLNSMSNEPMESCVLMQSTGLFDKNGVEIFEGDFLRRANGDSGKVFFNQPYASYDFAYKFKGSPMQIPLAQIVSDAGIIGNIHQNPELLIPT